MDFLIYYLNSIIFNIYKDKGKPNYNFFHLLILLQLLEVPNYISEELFNILF